MRPGRPSVGVSRGPLPFEDYRKRYMGAADQLVLDRHLLPEFLSGLEAIAAEHPSLFKP